jgi:hypothetical protein
VVVLAMLLIALVIGAAALAESLSTRSHTNFDSRQRRALQAADAGVQAVLYRQNQLDIGSLNLTGGSGILGTLAACLVPNLNVAVSVSSVVSAQVVSGKDACAIGQQNGANVPFSTTVPVGDHASYNAEFIPSATVPNQTSGVQFIGGKIISVGVDDSGDPNASNRYVYAKVQANLAPIDPFKTVEAAHDLTFKIPPTAVVGTTAFNGTARAGHQLFFDLQNNLLLSAFVGTNLLGPGNNVIGPTAIDVGCPGNAGANNAYTLLNRNVLSLLFVPAVTGGINVANPQTCSSPYWFTRSPISISSSKTCPASCSGLAGYSGGAQNEIYITNNAPLTLAPGDYVFCSFQTNGTINVTATANSAPVRIFVDSPTSSKCNQFASHASPPIGFQAGAGSFVATKGIGGLVGGVTGTLTPSQVQVYVVGTSSHTTVATAGPASAANAFFLYAPQSLVTVASLVSFAGTVVGWDVTMNTILYTQDLGLNNYPVSSSLGIFHVSQYAQCSHTVTSNTQSGLLTGTASTDTAGC